MRDLPIYPFRYFAIAAACLFATLYSCDSFVETDLPNSQLAASSVFEDKATADAAMTEVYSKIRNGGLLSGLPAGMGCALGHYADELDYYGQPANPVPEFYNNSLIASNRYVAEAWNLSYNQIYACNAVIEGVDRSVLLAQADRDRLKGEALFTRSLLHFYLAGLYGPVPYITTTDYRENSTAVRVPVAAVYDRILTDLETAKGILPEAYASAERVRPNRFAVMALAARVNLYAGNWAEAADAASGVLNQAGLYLMETDLNKVFLKGSTSAIWQLMPSIAGKNTDEALTFLFTAGPPPVTALTAGLVAAFDVADARKSNWIGLVTNGTANWYCAKKYKAGSTATTTVEYPIVLRIEEQYLIRAEARAIQGDLIGAKEDLNKVRNRAGLPDTTALSAEAIVEAVLQERRFEFFTEYGHRFFDLKRSGNLDNALSGLKPGWDSTDAFWPLPQAELLANPFLRPQNPGY